jgi:hypothetical protein
MPKYDYEYTFSKYVDHMGRIEAANADEAQRIVREIMEDEGYDPMDGEIIDLNIELDDE